MRPTPLTVDEIIQAILALPNEQQVEAVSRAFLSLRKKQQAEFVNALQMQPGNAVWASGMLAQNVAVDLADRVVAAKENVRRRVRKPVKTERGREIHRIITERGLKPPISKGGWKSIRDELDKRAKDPQQPQPQLSPRIKRTGKLVEIEALQNEYRQFLHAQDSGNA
jgi:hypothetical protein